MTDQALIEAAAKAAGIEGTYNADMQAFERHPPRDTPHGPAWTYWNPLTEQCDADALSSKLGLATGDDDRWKELGPCIYCTYPMGPICCDSIMQPIADVGGDRAAATRRAIVRAAAAMASAETQPSIIDTWTKALEETFPALAQPTLMQRHNTTPEQLHDMSRELCLWMHKQGIHELHISRTPGTAKFLTTIDRRPA